MPEKWEQLQQLRDELRLKAHLFEKEILELWNAILHRIEHLESKLVAESKAIGDAEMHFFVGSDEEINAIIAEMEQLKTQQQDSTSHVEDS